MATKAEFLARAVGDYDPVNEHDEENPAYLFSGKSTELLSAIVRGEIDAVALARLELANRGADHQGTWVGFEKAWRLAQLHRIPDGAGGVVYVSIPESEDK